LAFLLSPETGTVAFPLLYKMHQLDEFVITRFNTEATGFPASQCKQGRSFEKRLGLFFHTVTSSISKPPSARRRSSDTPRSSAHGDPVPPVRAVGV
jgi:hypothetical protein